MKFGQSSSPETPSWMNKTTMSEGVFQVDRRDEASEKKNKSISKNMATNQIHVA